MRYSVWSGTPNERACQGTFKKFPDACRRAQAVVKDQIKFCQIYDTQAVEPLLGIVEEIGKLFPPDVTGSVTFMQEFANVVFVIEIRREDDE